MPNRSTFVTLTSLVLDVSAAIPLYRQLYDALRAAILAGRLRPAPVYCSMRGETAGIEGPRVSGRTRGALLGAAAARVPVAVAREGIDVSAGNAWNSEARLVSVSPSQQYPYGITMSLPRGLELLAWATGLGRGC